MSGLYLCPSCNTQLKAPEGAVQIRCPNCKTVLSIAPTPEAPKTAAPPLPFGPKPSEPKVVVKKKAEKKKLKVRVVDEQAEAEDEQSRDAAEKKKKMRAELAKMEEEEEIEQEKFEQIKKDCHRGNWVMDLMIWGVRGQALAIFLEVCVMLLFISAAMTAIAGATTGKMGGAVVLLEIMEIGLKVLLPLAAVVSFLAVLSMIGAFGVAIGGPPKGLNTAIIGLVFSILHFLFVIAQAIFAIGRVLLKIRNNEELLDPTRPLWMQAAPLFDLCGLITELPLLSEHPARFAWGYSISWFGIIAGAMEFVRLVSICLLAQLYAELGQATEKGHKALKGAYRVFWLMLLAGIFRLVAAFAFDGFRTDDTFMILLAATVHSLITLSITLGLSMILYFLSQALMDIKEVVDPARFASKGPIAEL
jgi:LSD1 subclass zinc finger protein